MTDSPDLQQLARNGDQEALTTLINQALRKYQVTASLERRGDRLSIWLSGEEVPSKKLVKLLRQGLFKLQIPGLATLRISAHKNGDPKPIWSGSTKLVSQPSSDPSTQGNIPANQPIPETQPPIPLTQNSPSSPNVSGVVEPEESTPQGSPPLQEELEEEIPIPRPTRSYQGRSTHSMGTLLRSTGAGKFPISVEWMIAHSLAIPVLFIIGQVLNSSRNSIIESIALGLIFGAIQLMAIARRIRLTWVWGLITLGSFVLLRSGFGQGCLFLAGIGQWTLLQKRWRTGYAWLGFNVLGLLSSLSVGRAVFWDFDGYAFIIDVVSMVSYAIISGMLLEVALEHHGDRFAVKLFDFSGLLKSFGKRLQTINPVSAAHNIPFEEPKASLVAVVCSKWAIASIVAILLLILVSIPLSFVTMIPVVGIIVATILSLVFFGAVSGSLQESILKYYLGMPIAGWGNNTKTGFVLMGLWFLGSSLILGLFLPESFIRRPGLPIALVQLGVWAIAGGIIGFYQGKILSCLQPEGIQNTFKNGTFRLWLMTNSIAMGLSGFALTLFDVSSQYGLDLSALIVMAVGTLVSTILYPLSTGVVAGLIVAKQVENKLAQAK